MFVRQAFRPDTGIVPVNPPEYWPEIDLGKVQPLFERMNGAGLAGRSATDHNLVPARLPLDVQYNAAVSLFQITAAIIGLISADIQTGDLVIPPFLRGCSRRIHAAVFSFIAGVMPPMPMLGRSLL